MKITKIELENWCQYEGEHLVDLGHEEHKNVVLIHADNDVGKSSLFYSIAWCLHERQPEKWLKKKWPLYPLPWFNRSQDGSCIPTQVQITFEHRGELYCAIRRFETLKKNGSAIKTDESFQLLRKNYNDNWQVAGEEVLNRILPRTIGEYFIFDAEQVEHFANESDKVKQSVLRLLDIEDAQRMVDHLQIVSVELKRKFSTNKNDSKFDELQNHLTKVDNDIIKIKNELYSDDDGLKAKLKAAREQRKGIEEQLFTFKDAHDLLEEEKSAQNAITSNISKYEETIKKLKIETQKYYLAAVVPIGKEVFSFLDDKRKKGELPKNVKKQFVVERIQIGECICGTDLIHNPVAMKTMSDFAESLSDELSDISQTLTHNALKIEGVAKSVGVRIDELLRARQQLVSDRKKHDARLQEVRSKIQKREGIPDVPQLQAAKERLESTERYLIKEIEHQEGILANKIKSQENFHGLLKAVTKKSTQLDETEKQWALAVSVQDALNKALLTFKDKARLYLEQQCNNVAKELFWREDIYTVKINKDYGLSVSSPIYGEIDLLAGMSMGATQMAGLSLIAALAKQTKAQAPLIMDTPFARLSPAHITRALGECPKHFQQWILFLQPSEWDDSKYRQVINDFIQKEFTLKRDNSTGVTQVKEGYHKSFFGSIRG